jgi:hypothetical protein
LADSRALPEASRATSGDEEDDDDEEADADGAAADVEDRRDEEGIVAVTSNEEAEAEAMRGTGRRLELMISTACEGVRCRTSSCL